MNKKLSIIGTILLTAITIFIWQTASLPTLSKADLLEDLDKDLGSVFDPIDCNTDECCLSYRSAMGYVEKAWSENLDDITDQGKPVAEMVDEAYENLRTYDCWLQYICRAVEYSSYAPPETVGTSGLTSKHIGTVPGCQDPEDMGVPDTWDSFVQFLKDDWEILSGIFVLDGAKEVNVTFADSYFVNNGLPYFPQCMTDAYNKNASPDFVYAREQYSQCISILDSKFACDGSEEGLEDCINGSTAFVKIENALKRAHADQRARALENKFTGILTKMLAMEFRVEMLKTKLENLDALYACSPPKCD